MDTWDRDQRSRLQARRIGRRIPRLHGSVSLRSPTADSRRVAFVDIDLPFVSILKLMFNWIPAAILFFCCFIPAVIVIWLILAAIIAALMGGALPGFHHP